jgi:flagellar motor switch protein FliG
MGRQPTGPERATALLINLGEDIAAKVLVNLNDREIQNIGNYMSSLRKIC